MTGNGADRFDYDERPARDFFDYLEIPFRYPRHVLVPLVVALAVAVALVLFAPRKYRSGTLILVESKSIPAEYYVTPASAEALNQRVSTVRQLTLSRTRLEEIIEEVDPYPGMAGQPSHVVVDRMRAAIQIRTQGQDSFMFEYVNAYPYKAMVVTNMLAEQFIEDADRLREHLTRKAFELLKSNLEQARTTLEERESALWAFEQANWESLPDRLDSNLRMLQQLQLEQQTLGENLKTLEDRRASLEQNLIEGRRLIDAASGGHGGPAGELAKLQATYASLMGRYTDEHPDMRSLRSRIETLREQLAAHRETTEGPTDPQTAALRRALQPVEAEIEGLKTRRERLDERIALFKARVEATPDAKQKLAALTRDYGQIRDDYNTALRKEKDAEMAHKLEEFWRTGYFRVIDPAYLPGRPIMPYTLIYLVGGLLVGLVTGLAAALLADLFDRSVKSERDLEELLPFPLLATLPHAGLRRGRFRVA